MSRGPDFIIIGAMKCATSTLHEQLAAQGGFFMSDPKEPCYFSDDPVYARGWEAYTALFADARPGDLCGESSTHYTKLPTYSRTVERMAGRMPDVKLIYVMRHPVERLVSHYIHEWTERTIDGSIDDAVKRYPRLVQYGLYAMQLAPYFEAFGRERVLPVFQPRLRRHGQAELERIAAFLGHRGAVAWRSDLGDANVSAQRLRVSPWRDRIVNAPVLAALRRKLVPRGVRDRVKRLWTMGERPEPGHETLAALRGAFDADLARLGEWMGVVLDCGNFDAVTEERPLGWSVGEAGIR